MIFSSTLFLFLFLPAVFLLYYLIPARFLTLRNILLLCASVVFYAWGEPRVMLIIVVSIGMNYAFGLLVGRWRSRLWLVAAVVFNLGMLGYFKYTNFIAQNINAVFKTAFISEIALPIGISFFTFQIMSYVIDVYRGHVAPQKKIINLALYILFFPQLIAGPIVRYIDIEKQLESRSQNLENVAGGFQRFIVGLAQKVLIANQTAVFADYAFSANAPSSVAAWLGAVCYAMQIYFDFSGYSNMAIGLGHLFGFQFLENFNYPYTARTVQDFWRRWHISLSSWFRDYLYIPLGGNRKGRARTYINLLIVFLATGFWHGASWSFLLWGAYHGVFLMLERGAFGRLLQKLPRVVTWLYTMLAVLVGWVLFRAEDLPSAALYLRCMFDFSSGGLSNALANLNIFLLTALLLGVVGSMPVIPYLKARLFGGDDPFAASEKLGALKQAAVWLSMAGCLGLLALSVIFLTGSDFNPFLYFRF